MPKLLRISIISAFVMIGGCSLLYTPNSREPKVVARLEPLPGAEFQLYVYPGAGDLFCSAVNAFYRLPGETKWRSYYVNHEAPVRGWTAKLVDNDRFIAIQWLGSREIMIECATGDWYDADGNLHSKNIFYISGTPADTQYPVDAYKASRPAVKVSPPN